MGPARRDAPALTWGRTRKGDSIISFETRAGRLARAAAAIAALLAASAALAACGGSAAPAPGPRVQTEGAGVACPAGDHALADAQLGWSFCYPASWRFRERAQSSPAPVGMDLTFDITDDSQSGPDRGLFGYMIIGTYERGSSPTLQGWVATNVGQPSSLQPLAWGNASDAGYLPSTGQWFALTGHHVIELTVREGDGNLPLSSEMRQRFATWRFSV